MNLPKLACVEHLFNLYYTNPYLQEQFIIFNSILYHISLNIGENN